MAIPKHQKISELLDFINGMTTAEQFFFAQRCDTSPQHIRNVAHGYSPCSEKLAINLDRESKGKIRCELVRSDVDWKYVSERRRRKKKA